MSVRREIVIIALICFAIIGMVSASDSAPPSDPKAAATNPKVAAAEVPSSSSSPDHDDDDIGTDDGDEDAAPVGAPVSESTFHNLTPSPSPHSGATALEFSVVSGIAATVVAAAAAFPF